jgi:hypothetical protein
MRLYERRRGRRRGAREGACTGAATLPRPSTLRLIRNAADLAASSPTLLFNDCKNAARYWLRCDGTPVAVKCASVSRWASCKRRRKNSPPFDPAVERRRAEACGWKC